MLKREVRLGFTLLETVIGLGIFCFLTTISLYNLKDFQAKVEEKQTLEWFKDSFKTAFNEAYLTRQSATFNIENNREVVFTITKDGRGAKRIISRVFPSTMKIYKSSSNQYAISYTGEAQPVTITIKSDLTKKKYIYTFQMGWGEITEKKT